MTYYERVWKTATRIVMGVASGNLCWLIGHKSETRGFYALDGEPLVTQVVCMRRGCSKVLGAVRHASKAVYIPKDHE